MDSILKLQKRKQEIEQQNSIVNMLISLRNAFDELLSKLQNGDKQAELQIPFPCQFAMNMSGQSNIYDFIDTLRYSLSDYLSSLIFSISSSKDYWITVRSYTGKDVQLSEWISEISNLLDDITSWRNDLSDSLFKAKYQ